MKTQELIIKNRKGKRMPTTIRTPDGEAKGTMVLLHGLGGWKDQSIITAVAEAISALGYVVYTFDAADGAKGPDNDFFQQTTTEYLEDLEDFIQHIKENERFHTPLLLAGHSMGGMVSLMYSARHPNEVSKLLLIAPAVSWKMMWWAQIPWAVPWMITGSRVWVGPPGSKLHLSSHWLWDFFTHDGYKDAKQVMIPVVIVSAQRDETVARPYEHRAFARHFKNARQITIPRADHDFVRHEKEVADTMRQWLTSS